MFVKALQMACIWYAAPVPWVQQWAPDMRNGDHPLLNQHLMCQSQQRSSAFLVGWNV